MESCVTMEHEAFWKLNVHMVQDMLPILGLQKGQGY